MSREAWGDPPEREPALCPLCGEASHRPDCELGEMQAKWQAAEAEVSRLRRLLREGSEPKAETRQRLGAKPAEPGRDSDAPNNRSAPGSAPTGEAQPLTDEQIDALMPEPCDSLAQDDGFNVIGEQDVWDRAQVRSIIRAALATHPAPSAAPAQPVAIYVRQDQLQKAQRAPRLCELTMEPRQDRVPLYAAPPAAQPVVPAEVALADHIEQRMRMWRQRTMNKSGDRLALDDFMGKDSIDDLIDFVCDEWALIAAAPSAAIVDAKQPLGDAASGPGSTLQPPSSASAAIPDATGDDPRA